MYEFQEVMKQWRRICMANERCSSCPLNNADCCISDPDSRTDVDIETLEELITNWADEHPEPVYQTWGEWFIQRGDLVEGWYNATNTLSIVARCDDVFDKPIPADIAEKLGLEPKSYIKEAEQDG